MKKYIIGGVFSIIALGWIILFVTERFNDFSYAGTLEYNKTIVASKVANDLVYNPLNEGEFVKEGQIIAKVNDDIYQVNAKQLDADYERYLELYKRKAVPKSDLDSVERQKLENDLKIKWCEVKAPISGMVLTVYRELGDYVGQGSALVSIADPYKIWAYFYLPYDKIHKLRPGDVVWGHLQEVPNKKFKGKILKINEEAEFTPKNVQTRAERTRLVYGVKVQFENEDLTLKAGMTMEADFE